MARSILVVQIEEINSNIDCLIARTKMTAYEKAIERRARR